ncbi:MAG: hypothetical protein COB83_04455 [Gammaproteobacteria bacterium]|nr:MAG: hypothetical protein COB83_04455 [Gammaproteobacteria bacterium]
MRKKIYLIPGTMCTEQLWSNLLPLLINSVAHHYEFVHVKIPKDKNLIQIITFLDSFFTEDRAIIIGFSLGGYIASYFAATYPQRVDKIFVIANSPCALNHKEIKQRQAIVKFINQHSYKGISKARATQLLDSKKWTKEQLNQLVATIVNMDAKLGELEFVSQMQNTTHRTDLFEPLTRSSVASTYCYSKDDLLVNSSWLDKLQQANPRCQMICISGASHMLVLEKPKELAIHIQTWLSTY